jgi:hypothetical protein
LGRNSQEYGQELAIGDWRLAIGNLHFGSLFQLLFAYRASENGKFKFSVPLETFLNARGWLDCEIAIPLFVDFGYAIIFEEASVGHK